MPDLWLPKLAMYPADPWEHVCPVVRLTGPAAAAGIEVLRGVERQADESPFGQMVISPEQVEQADLVLIQRDFPVQRQACAEVLAAARRRGVPVVYELDDLLFELPEAHPDKTAYMRTRSAILRLVVEADAVIGSSQPLVDVLRQYNPNAHLWPNYLDERLWRTLNPLAPPRRKRMQRGDDALVIGYVGGHSHAYDLALLEPLLADMLARHGERLRLKFWGVAPPASLRGHPRVEWVRLALGRYADFATYWSEQDCDIFIAPLQDNLFNRCKSAIKYLEYSALGVPGVYSRIAPYETVIRHGENGFLASSLEEWGESLEQLIGDAALRQALGQAALEDVQRHHLLSTHAADWAGLLRQLAARPDMQPGPGIEHHGRINHGQETMTHSPEHTQRALEKMSEWQAELEERLASQGEQLKRMNRSLGELKVQLDERNQAYLSAYGLYLDIMNSNGWKLMMALFRWRQRLFPQGGRLERLARLALYALRVLKNEGPAAFLRGVWRRGVPLASGQAQTSAERLAPPEPVKVTVQDGVPGLSPALTLLLVQGGELESVELHALQSWLRRQTLAQEAQVAVWQCTGDSAQQWQAYIVPGSHSALKGTEWAAPDLPAVCAGLTGRYLCLASADLLAQPETYLETNLLALESGTLAFCVNLHGHTPWARQLLSQGLLPGTARNPLLRMVVAKDCLKADFSLDLGLWTQTRREFPNLVGRVLQQVTDARDLEGALPFEQRLTPQEGQAPAQLVSDWIFMSGDQGPGNPMPLPGVAQQIPVVLHPLQSVLPGYWQPETWSRPLDARRTVFVIMPFLAVGGAEVHALKVMRQLQERVRFVVISYEGLDPALGTTTDAFRAITPYVYNLSGFLHPALNGSFTEALIERFGPQTVWIPNGTNWIYDALPDLKTKYPQLRILNMVYDQVVGWITRYDLSLVLHLDGHIGVNSHICQAYIEKGAKPESVYQIENGIDPAEFNPADYPPERVQALKLQIGLPLERKVITFASRVHAQKRPMDFVELARRFSDDPGLVFLMVGDGPLATEVDAQIIRSGLKNIVRLPFYRPLSDIFALSDVFVLPSDFEGMPMVILEAQAMGVPVVVTDVGNNREVLGLTQGGVVVDRPGDVAALMAGVRQMLQAGEGSPGNEARLRQAVLAHFDIALVAEKYLAAFLGAQHD